MLSRILIELCNLFCIHCSKKSTESFSSALAFSHRKDLPVIKLSDILIEDRHQAAHCRGVLGKKRVSSFDLMSRQQDDRRACALTKQLFHSDQPMEASSFLSQNLDFLGVVF